MKTERNYAQIEKECLAIVFATSRFEQYILGKEDVKILTDHKTSGSNFHKVSPDKSEEAAEDAASTAEVHT